MKISKTYEWDMAHRLQRHTGKCARLHGHRYRLTVVVSGNVTLGGASDQMVMDYGDIDAYVKPLIDTLDHRVMLEKSDPLCDAVSAVSPESVVTVSASPTAEFIATWFSRQLSSATCKLDGLCAIEVKETDRTSATWVRL